MSTTARRLAVVAAVLLVGIAILVLSLPSLLQALGLHPDYVGQRYRLADGRALSYDLAQSPELGAGITAAWAAGGTRR